MPWTGRQFGDYRALSYGIDDLDRLCERWMDEYASHIGIRHSLFARTLCAHVQMFARSVDAARSRVFHKLVDYASDEELFCKWPRLLTRHDSDRLTVQLASTFDESLSWLGNNDVTRHALLMAYTHDIIAMVSAALYRIDRSAVTRIQERRPLLPLAIAESFDLTLESMDLDDLKGCLVVSPSGGAIYCNDRLSQHEREFVVCHEIGHLKLAHVANSSYGLSTSVASAKDIDRAAAQDAEADGYATLCQHVITGVMALLEDRDNSLLNTTPVSTPAYAALLEDNVLSESRGRT
jgi:hypothetical protein